MRQLLLLLALLHPSFQSSPAQTDQPYTYKGFVIGVTTFAEFSTRLSAKQTKLIEKTQCFKPQNGIRSCNLGGLKEPITGTFTFVNDRLAIFETGIAGYPDVLRGYVDALTEKFGPPTITTEAFQNGFGATRTGHVWTWHNSVSTVVLHEMVGDVSTTVPVSSLLYADLKLSTEILTRTEKKPEL